MPPIGALLSMFGGGGGGSAPVSATGAPSESGLQSDFSVTVGNRKVKWWQMAIIAAVVSGLALIAFKLLKGK